MNLFAKKEPKTYNLLSIGQRGVGKTVFLAGSCLELTHAEKNQNIDRFGLEYQDQQAQENVRGILEYIGKNGQYPPATMKMTKFNFNLKQHGRFGENTFCNFRWWDIPGESCNIDSPDFQKIVLGSNSCCLFVNAYELMTKPNYLATLEPLVKQVIAIASLVNQHQMNYVFAIILTQCDRVDTGAIGRIKIEQKLQPMLARFNLAKANYRHFYSSIALEVEGDRVSLKPQGAAAPLIWIASQLNQSDELQSDRDLETGINQEVSLSPSSMRSSSSRSKSKLILPLVGLGVVAAIAATPFIFGIFQPKPTDTLVSLVERTNLYLEQQQLDRALPLMEQIVVKDPKNLAWQLNLANVYELTNRDDEAEKIYDRILTQQPNNLDALIQKASLRIQQKDLKTAKSLFARAEKAALTDDQKARVRSIAQMFLQ
ncbi:MAG: tetratricopeptide repeat protein [Xenococcaceae cyanobacterium]